jgi:glycosyltransferase involved in cell wall biosynthesis
VAALVADAGYPPARTLVVESGTDATALAAKAPDEALRRWANGRPLAGSVGKLGPKKNWEFLLRTAAAARGRGLDLRWVIAGDGPGRASLAALRDRLGLRDHVLLDHEARDPERVVKALDVMFHPSRREGGSAILRVAMFSGVPVVAASAPALVDALEGFGLVVDPDDAEAAARAVARVLLDGRERARLVDGARQVAHRRFRVESMVEGTLAVYASLTGTTR